MNNQINIVVQNQVYLLNRELLINESQNKQIKTSKDFTLPFPQWVTKPIYLLIEKYLRTKDVGFLEAYVNQNQVVVKVLRTADYLGMVKFHDKFINQVLIPKINHQNSLTLLEQSHKKLKNINDSQTWYNLLNMSIIYLSNHAYQIFQLNPARFKKLNQKIITQILERVIRLERKNNFENKHKLYQLIMECKQAHIGQPRKLFESMRANLKAKKIHSKIHAKLSWKLENIPQLNEKNTKNFKYLDMNWFLRANKAQQGLIVTLNLLPLDQNQSNFRSSQSEFSESSQKSAKSLQISKQKQQKNQIQIQTEQTYKNDTFTRIGVFYSKVNWKFQQQAFQQQIKIHYILMNEYSSMDIILIDRQMQQMIGHDKVQLTIYCNTETIYTFLINYVFWHFDGLSFKGISFSQFQMIAFVKASKKLGNYSQALKITSELFSAYPSCKGNAEISQGYEFSKMTKVELEIYSSIFGKKLMSELSFNKQRVPELQQPEQVKLSIGSNQQKRTISPIPITPISSINKKSNFSSSSSQLVVNGGTTIAQTPSSTHNKQKIGSFNRTSSGRENNFPNINIQSLTNSRGDSRGSKRKIFSGSESGQIDRREDLMAEMMKVTDMSRYLNPDLSKNPEFQKLFSLLKL